MVADNAWATRHIPAQFGDRIYLRTRNLRYGRRMAISDIKEYAHLTEADVEALGRELDAIR
ncbi:hypothetical protein, partial [Rhodococcus rhodochrous]|uniref:hypothetical protein n=1 Tax=Rhodococcus rhodochrous TaxID=1829 RepID=UPI00128F4206